MTHLIQIIQKSSTDFTIWLCLIALTLISASIAESGSANIGATIFVCSIVIIKSRWVINEFMGLKHANPLTRRIVKGYFYTMTCMVALTIIYTQTSLHSI